ncbi:MAG: hypothetical protein K8F91_02615, partial [Candidatus Obscuribacterales bacterium]|nr:hypothetical protein [Candidatus Obscuribacterales bacterium]
MLAISSAVIFFLQGLNRLYYETDQWKSVYRHINASWSLLNTDRLNSPNEKISKALETVEWRPIDRDIFLHWYPLSSRYSTDSLNKLNSALPLISPDADLALLKNKLLEIIMNRTVLTMLFLIASLALFFTSSRLTRWQACSFILGLCLLLVGLLITMKLPPRVYSSIFLVTSLIFLFYSSPKKLAHGLADKPLKLLLSSVVALSIIYPSIHLYKKSSLKRAKERHSLHDFTDQLRSYARLQPRPPLFIAWAASFPFELISPLEDLRSYFKDLKFTGFNSMDTSPIILNRLEQYGITNALEELDKDSVIQIADDRIKSSLESYSIETLQRRPVFQPVAKSNTPRITADKVFLSEKTARPDTDQFPDCPDFKKTSLLLYPIKGRPPELMDIVIKSTSSNTSKLEVRGREPLIGFEAPKTTRPQKYAWFLLEAKLAESCTINREISIWLQLNGDRRFRRFFIRLLNDGNMHRYSFELNKLGLEESDS